MCEFLSDFWFERLLDYFGNSCGGGVLWDQLEATWQSLLARQWNQGGGTRAMGPGRWNQVGEVALRLRPA